MTWVGALDLVAHASRPGATMDTRAAAVDALLECLRFQQRLPPLLEEHLLVEARAIESSLSSDGGRRHPDAVASLVDLAEAELLLGDTESAFWHLMGARAAMVERTHETAERVARLLVLEARVRSGTERLGGRSRPRESSAGG